MNLGSVREKLRQVQWRVARWPSSRFPLLTAEHVVGIACTGHGASIAYAGADGVVRSSVLDRWTGIKYTMMFSAEEDYCLRHPQEEIDRQIHALIRYGFGRFPESRIFEESFAPWLEWLLRDLDIRAADIDLVVTSDGHFATGWARLGPELQRWFPAARIFRGIEHHEIHQRQAFWQSGFEEAAVLTLDTCGESLNRVGGRKLSGTIALMNQQGRCRVLNEFLFPDSSAGLIYSIVTDHVGFHQGDEGKTMGLAPYGEPDLFEQLHVQLRLHEDGSFEFMPFADLAATLQEYVPRRQPGEELSRRHMDVAYAGQALIELIVTNAWQASVGMSGSRNLAYAGGVALNSVANERAYREARPEKLYIATNPGDTGQALGCALFGAYELAGWPPPHRELPEYLGPPYPLEEMEAAARSSRFTLSRPAGLDQVVSRCIANGHIVARFAGQSEFGPRALGNRSILGDPRRPDMKDYLNARVKHREGFRPFAPTVLEEYAGDWFDVDGRSPYMLRVVPVWGDKLAQVPAIVHVDGTARIQTVSRQENPGYWSLIQAFHEQTGVPLVLNTSFNIAGKPIVETPRDAVDCFERTEIDVLVLGPFVLSKGALEEFLQRPRS